MEIVCSELSHDAWFVKKSAEALIQVRKIQLGIARRHGEFS